MLLETLQYPEREVKSLTQHLDIPHHMVESLTQHLDVFQEARSAVEKIVIPQGLAVELLPRPSDILLLQVILRLMRLHGRFECWEHCSMLGG